MAKQWTNPTIANITFDVALNEDGNIATSEQTVAGKKSYTLNNIKHAAEFSDCATVFSTFVGAVGGRYDENSGVKTVKYTVADVEENPEP